jgi:hypothetical protein
MYIFITITEDIISMTGKIRINRGSKPPKEIEDIIEAGLSRSFRPEDIREADAVLWARTSGIKNLSRLKDKYSS